MPLSICCSQHSSEEAIERNAFSYNVTIGLVLIYENEGSLTPQGNSAPNIGVFASQCPGGLEGSVVIGSNVLTAETPDLKGVVAATPVLVEEKLFRLMTLPEPVVCSCRTLLSFGLSLALRSPIVNK